jgi:hypothetical protein
MVAFLRKNGSTCRTLLVAKTDRLYRNIKDWVTIDELGIEVHFVKENVVLSEDSRSSEQFMHGIKVHWPQVARFQSRRSGDMVVSYANRNALAIASVSCSQRRSSSASRRRPAGVMV